MGYHDSTVSSNPSSAIREIETQTGPGNLNGYGSDSGGGRTAQLLLYLQQRFGHVSSFSGSYRADNWELNITRSTSTCSFFAINHIFTLDEQAQEKLKAVWSLLHLLHLHL